MYAESERVRFTYRGFDAVDNFTGTVTELATITRVWKRGDLISLRTDTGKLFVRHVNSPTIERI